jgi:GrpB-like predicted nucleotidyltransferase (UPF0157 family)
MSYPAVVIVAYDPQWPARFEEERRRITAALGARAVAVEHVGSTAVPGLAAKPIIDIMVGVRDLAGAFADCSAALQSIGYLYVPWPRRPDRHFFQRGPWGARTHHLHLTEFGGAMWERYLLFRDHLRAHPDVARQYLELKRQVAARPNIDRPAYNAAKRPLIDGVIARLAESMASPSGKSSELESTRSP